MKIVCPSCAATYEVPEAVATSRRPVRCARCGVEWAPGGAASEEGAEPPVPAPVAPDDAPASETVPQQPDAETPAPLPVAAATPQSAPPTEPAPVAPAPPAPAAAAPRTRAPDAVAPPPVAPRFPPPPIRSLEETAALSPRGAPKLAWLASLLLLLGMAGAAVTYRDGIMRAWPPSARLYAALGLYQPR